MILRELNRNTTINLDMGKTENSVWIGPYVDLKTGGFVDMWTWVNTRAKFWIILILIVIVILSIFSYRSLFIVNNVLQGCLSRGLFLHHQSFNKCCIQNRRLLTAICLWHLQRNSLVLEQVFTYCWYYYFWKNYLYTILNIFCKMVKEYEVMVKQEPCFFQIWNLKLESSANSLADVTLLYLSVLNYVQKRNEMFVATDFPIYNFSERFNIKQISILLVLCIVTTAPVIIFWYFLLHMILIYLHPYFVATVF